MNIENKILKIEDNRLIEFDFDERKLDKIEHSKLHLKRIDEQNTLVLNSFQDTAYIFPTRFIVKGELFCPNSLVSSLETPNEHNRAFFKSLVNFETNSKQNDDVVTVLVTMSYACNLKCDYCFQQNYPGLKKKPISEFNLEMILSNIKSYMATNPSKVVEIGLFGGEPLLPQNEKIINRILNFSAENKIRVQIITNGLNLDYFAKTLIIYRRVISMVGVTLDSTDVEIRRINNKKLTTYKLINLIDLLLQHGVEISVSSQIDRTNLHEIKKLVDMFEKKNWAEMDNFSWSIGRVDDRLYETNYPNILTESELVEQLSTISPFRDNYQSAFIQTGANILKKFNLLFNKGELKGKYNYCWSSSPYDRAFYIDNDLDIYRCTVTVGRKELSIGNLSDTSIWDYQLPNNTFLDDEKCSTCSIGGYCSGGCQLSNNINFEKQCRYELSAFDDLLERVVIPHIMCMEDYPSTLKPIYQ